MGIALASGTDIAAEAADVTLMSSDLGGVPEAIRLAVRAWIRHQHTNYDELLMRGIPRDVAREQIAATVDNVAAQWSSG